MVPLDIQDFLRVFKKFAVAEDMFPVAKCVTGTLTLFMHSMATV